MGNPRKRIYKWWVFHMKVTPGVELLKDPEVALFDHLFVAIFSPSWWSFKVEIEPGWWLSLPLWKIMEFVSWDDFPFPIWWESHNPVMFQSPPTRNTSGNKLEFTMMLDSTCWILRVEWPNPQISHHQVLESARFTQVSPLAVHPEKPESVRLTLQKNPSIPRFEGFKLLQSEVCWSNIVFFSLTPPLHLLKGLSFLFKSVTIFLHQNPMFRSTFSHVVVCKIPTVSRWLHLYVCWL